MLRRIFGPKKVELTGRLRKLYKEEELQLYFLSIINRVIKSWTGHVTCMGS
jgi:hypothetical protein